MATTTQPGATGYYTTPGTTRETAAGYTGVEPGYEQRVRDGLLHSFLPQNQPGRPFCCAPRELGMSHIWQPVRVTESPVKQLIFLPDCSVHAKCYCVGSVRCLRGIECRMHCLSTLLTAAAELHIESLFCGQGLSILDRDQLLIVTGMCFW